MRARFPIEPIDLQRSFLLHRFGVRDPTATLTRNEFSKTFLVEGEAVNVRLTRAEAGEVHVEGPDDVVAPWLEGLAGGDGLDGFRPDHPVLVRLARRHPGLRLIPAPWLFDIACTCVLQQRVRFRDASREYRRLVTRFGVESNFGRPTVPAPRELARLGIDPLISCGIDPRRARVLVRLAYEEARAPFLSLQAPPGHLRQRLDAIRGIGPWTREMILLFGAGDPDAVPTGDLHLPHAVASFFHGRRRGNDEEMLATLRPFQGHRGRVARLILTETLMPPR